MLGEVSGELEADGGLDFSGADGGLLVGASKSGSLGGDLVEHILDEGVQDLDGLGGEGEALLGVLVDAVDVGVEARSVSLAVTLSHFDLRRFFEKFFSKKVVFVVEKDTGLMNNSFVNSGSDSWKQKFYLEEKVSIQCLRNLILDFFLHGNDRENRT